MTVALRPATSADCERIYGWNFAPDVRAVSGTATTVPYDQHAAWFTARLNAVEVGAPIWIVEVGGVPVGSVRIDLDGRISIALGAARAWTRDRPARDRRRVRRVGAPGDRADSRRQLGESRLLRTLRLHRRRPQRRSRHVPMEPVMDTHEQTTSQIDLWRSDFGRAYTDRNDFENPARIATWKRVLEGISPARVVEVGCNIGWNLSYLQRLGVPELYGIEPQRYAVERARQRSPEFNVLQGTAFELPFRDGWCELAFTSGVLIHIAPDDVPRAMDEMYRVSARYVVAIEYDAPVEQEIAYRGTTSSLWKRDHGAIWQAQFPDLTLVRRFELGAADGYDDCTAHVFEKTGSST